MILPYFALAALAAFPYVAAAPAFASSTSSTTSEPLSKPVAASTTVPKVTSSPQVQGKNPCAIVSAEAAAIMSANPDATQPLIAAEDGINCLKSVPINMTDALALVDSLQPYFEFQSTLDILKNPPPGYLLPGVDILAGLGGIRLKLQEGFYSNEFDFQSDISLLVFSAYDGHFAYSGDIGSGVSFARTFDLISVSSDGQQLPKIYVNSDISLALASGFTPSAVTIINGQDAASFMEDLSLINNIQDPDALYNNAFIELAQTSFNQSNVFSSPNIYPGPETTLTFENGTTQKIPNVASVIGDFTGVDSGEEYYKKFCAPSSTTSAAAASSSTTTSPTSQPTAPNYPYPVIKHSQNFVGGYFLNGTDVAVLSIPSFDPPTNDLIEEFQEVVQKFFAECQKNGKRRLVIDLQGNGGGKVLLGYDTFKQLFPSLEPYGGSNLRDHETMNIIGQQASELIAQIPQNNLQELADNGADDWYNFRAELTKDNTPFKSWEEVYGPEENSYGNFTNVLRSRLDWPVHTILAAGIYITGYNNRSTGFTQPFAAENIIMVTDGYCASTCAVFSEFMKQQAGVQAVALGGRPFLGPMQAVGGVKGAETQNAMTILSDAQDVLQNATKAQIQKWKAESSLLDINGVAPSRSIAGNQPGFNLRNNIRQGDTSLTPLHFVYEAADCRLFYTPDMVANITRVWEKTAEVAFAGAKQFCVTGSTGQPTSVSGGGANSTFYGSPPASVPAVRGNGRAGGISKMGKVHKKKQS